MTFTYSQLPLAACREVGFNAGSLLTSFDPRDGGATRGDMLGQTSGPVRFAARPTFIDLGAGVLNCPANAREMRCLGGWDVRLTGTLITADAASTRRLAALARLDGARITPRSRLEPDDFGELWLVFDYGDPAAALSGYAIRIRNALSIGGLQLALVDAGRARWPFEFAAHWDLSDGAAPFEVYVGF